MSARGVTGTDPHPDVIIVPARSAALIQRHLENMMERTNTQITVGSTGEVTVLGTPINIRRAKAEISDRLVVAGPPRLELPVSAPDKP